MEILEHTGKLMKREIYSNRFEPNWIKNAKTKSVQYAWYSDDTGTVNVHVCQIIHPILFLVSQP